MLRLALLLAATLSLTSAEKGPWKSADLTEVPRIHGEAEDMMREGMSLRPQSGVHDLRIVETDHRAPAWEETSRAQVPAYACQARPRRVMLASCSPRKPTPPVSSLSR